MVKSDLDIPESSFKFISLYLLFSIGFKGGQELAHHDFNAGVLYAILFGIAIAAVIPIYSFLPIGNGGCKDVLNNILENLLYQLAFDLKNRSSSRVIVFEEGESPFEIFFLIHCI